MVNIKRLLLYSIRPIIPIRRTCRKLQQVYEDYICKKFSIDYSDLQEEKFESKMIRYTKRHFQKINRKFGDYTEFGELSCNYNKGECPVYFYIKDHITYKYKPWIYGSYYREDKDLKLDKKLRDIIKKRIKIKKVVVPILVPILIGSILIGSILYDASLPIKEEIIYQQRITSNLIPIKGLVKKIENRSFPIVYIEGVGFGGAGGCIQFPFDIITIQKEDKGLEKLVNVLQGEYNEEDTVNKIYVEYKDGIIPFEEINKIVFNNNYNIRLLQKGSVKADGIILKNTKYDFLISKINKINNYGDK